MKRLFLVGLLAVAAANAAITPFLVYGEGGAPVTAPPACTAAGTNASGDQLCRYDYTIRIHAGYEVQEGDFFTIYDFNDLEGGFLAGAGGQAANWDTDVSMVGPIAPVQPGATDQPGVHNITWTYTGTNPIVAGPIGAPSGDVFVTGFYAISTSNLLAVTHFSANTNIQVPPSPSANGSGVFGPAPGDSDTVVPEPMSMALLGGGLSLIGMLKIRKRS